MDSWYLRKFITWKKAIAATMPVGIALIPSRLPLALKSPPTKCLRNNFICRSPRGAYYAKEF